MKDEQEIGIHRTSSHYENLSQRFLFKKQRKFDLQYAQFYAIRLMALKSRTEKAATEKWGEDIPIKPLVDIKKDEKCIIIGTVFRHMDLQPSIIKEISTEEGVLPIPPCKKYISDSDEIILEEQQQRITLTGNISMPYSVTGVIIAACGSQTKNGKFHVSDVCFPHLSCRSSIDVDRPLTTEDNSKYVFLISGLGIGGGNTDNINLQLLIDLITGCLGTPKQQKLFSQICRVIIAGNVLSPDTQDVNSNKVAKYLSRNTQAKSVNAVKLLDDFLVQIGNSVEVDIMGGEYDPTNQFLPQQALHKCMFPKASSYGSVQSVTNPYICNIEHKRFVGTSGQNVNNIYQYSGYDDRMEILQATMNFSHIAPTCPDTLSCYPYYAQDPFIIEETPDVYFAGNQPEFQTKLMNVTNGDNVRLICVPEFSSTSIGVFVNLDDLSCIPCKVNGELN